MQVPVHSYATTERVGLLDIDEETGAVRILEGPPELAQWAAENADGYYTTRSHCATSYCDVGYWVNLPGQREFREQMERALVSLGLCTPVLAAVIRNHPQFIEHPWRRARQGEPACNDAHGPSVRFRLLEGFEKEDEPGWPLGIALQGDDGTVLRFSLGRLFSPLAKPLEELDVADFPDAYRRDQRGFGPWRPGPLREGRLPSSGNLLDFMFQTLHSLPEPNRDVDDDDDVE